MVEACEQIFGGPITEMNPFKSRLENSSLLSGIPWGDGPHTTVRP
jgi:hypothetical protein